MNELTVTLVAILFPGVLLTIIYDNYTEHRPWDAFRYTLYSIVSGIITYATLQGFIFLFQFAIDLKGFMDTDWKVLSVWSVLEPKATDIINPIEIISAGFVSILIGLVAVKVTQQNIIHNLLMRFKISNKYGDSSVFTKTLDNTGDCYIRVVILDENLTVEGIISLYSDDGEKQEIKLIHATVFNTKVPEENYRADKIYISKPSGNLMIYIPTIEEDESEQE